MGEKNQPSTNLVEDFWRGYLMAGPPMDKIRRSRFYLMLPSQARCRFCHAPFNGMPGTFVKTIWGVQRSRYNPHYCNVCDEFSKQYQGGAEVPITMLFADIRGSSGLAEKIGPKEFSELINRFYVQSTEILSRAGAVIEKLVGDEVTAIFSRGLAGENYTGAAITAARELLRATGHGGSSKPWVQVGIGIHSGTAFVGSVGKPNGVMEVAALGDVPNTAARLTSMAGPGEILVSEEAAKTAGEDTQGVDQRRLPLRGHAKDISVFVYKL